MWLWNKLVDPWWIEAKEGTLRQYAGNDLAVIDRPGHKRLRLEVACKTRKQAHELTQIFGGESKKLPRDWLDRSLRAQKAAPLRIGSRLIITRRGGFFGSHRTGAIWKSPFPGKAGQGPVTLNVRGTSASRRSRPRGPSHVLIIPAGAAFGTGEHVTTAMCLRLLEEITRNIKPDWSAADIGTGSGVLALAAKCFSAGRVVAVDIDARAVSTARANAHLNKIKGIDFRHLDAHEWRPRGKFEIVMANLFSRLLLEILPKLKAKLRSNGWLILSGILRSQERELMRGLRASKFVVLQVRRRGKWTALLCSGGL